MMQTAAGRGKGQMLSRRALLVGAVLCAGIALIATLWVARRPAAPPAPTAGQEPVVKKVSVVVAARDLSKGQRLSVADVRLVALPEEQVPKDAVSQVEVVENALLLQDVPRETPLRLSQVLPSPEHFREFRVPIGMRGFVLYQPFTEGAADLLLPGDLVDVIATRRQGEVTVAEVIVRGAQVLVAENFVPGKRREEMVRQRILAAAEQKTPSPPQPEPTQPPSALPEGEGSAAQATMRRIVLAVTPAEAVRLARALEEGRALTVLRNEQDHFPLPPLRSPQVLPKEREAAAPLRPRPTAPIVTPPSPMPAPHTVVVYRGTQREEVVFPR